MNNNRYFAKVFINNKEYHFLHKMAEGDFYYGIASNGVIRHLKTPAIIAKINTAIIESAHIEAMELNEVFDWERVSHENKAIHHQRVILGMDLCQKHNVDRVIDACYMEAVTIDLMEYTNSVTLIISNERSKHATIKDALEVYNSIVDAHCITGYGVSTWPHNNKTFLDTHVMCFRISFNGRLWFPDGIEYKI